MICSGNRSALDLIIFSWKLLKPISRNDTIGRDIKHRPNERPSCSIISSIRRWLNDVWFIPY